nr:hypothetical protein [Candidatus Freyarchaeota archaeon]
MAKKKKPKCKSPYASRKLKEKRVFNGENYYLSKSFKKKEDAKKLKNHAKEQGAQARIVHHKHHKLYSVYTR